MKKIGIIAAMEEEIRTLTQTIDIKKQSVIAGSEFTEGIYKEQEIVWVQSGIGKVNASIAAVLLIQHFECEGIINTGSAGGIGKGLQVGDVVLSTHLSYYDADARAFGYTLGQIPQMPASFPSSEALRNIALVAADQSGLKASSGMILTGDSFVSGGSKMQSIKSDFPDALVVEMEGAAIAQTCWKFDVPCLVIRAVSDTADDEAARSFDEFIVEAGRKSAEMVLKMIEKTEVL